MTDTLTWVTERHAQHMETQAPKRPAPKPRGLSQREQVIQFMQANPNSVYSPPEIDERLALYENAASKRLTELVREGLVTHLGEGQYKWGGSK